MKSLDTLSRGQSGIITSFKSGGRFLSRITAMGFTLDVGVLVIRNSGRGPIIVSLRDTDVALGRGEARKIIIKEVSCGYGSSK